MERTLALHNALAAVCPIDGVSVGSWLDKSTWRIDFSAAATDDQKQAAQTAVAVFDPAAPNVPETISDRQFFQALAIQAVITHDEAIAAVTTGTLPASMAQLVANMPAEQQFSANMVLRGATQFDRHNPIVSVLGHAYGWSDTQIDSLWISASQL